MNERSPTSRLKWRWRGLVQVLLLLLLILAVAATVYWHRHALPEEIRAVGIDDPALTPLQWAELMPPDWDPMQRFRDRQVNQVSDNDPRARALLAEMDAAWSQARHQAAANSMEPGCQRRSSAGPS